MQPKTSLQATPVSNLFATTNQMTDGCRVCRATSEAKNAVGMNLGEKPTSMVGFLWKESS